MKVLHVIPSLNPELGGPTQVALDLVHAQREMGIDAEIATTNDMGKTEFVGPLGSLVIYEGVPVRFFPRSRFRLREYIFSWSLTHWLWQNVRSYDLVETHYLFTYATTCAVRIARMRQVPYAMRTSGQLSEWALRYKPLRKQFYAALLERSDLNHARRVWCTAEAEVRDATQFGVRSEIRALPLGVSPLPEFPGAREKLQGRYGIPSEKAIVLYLSRLHPKKQPEVLIEALRGSVELRERAHLILAGSGSEEYERTLRALAESPTDNPKLPVTFAGFVSGNDKLLLLRGSDIFALPTFSENFGIAIAEAMACRLPVLVTCGVQISDDIERSNAGILAPGNSEAFGAALLKLLRDPGLLSSLATNAEKLAREKFSWERIALELAAEYQALISPR